MNMREHVKNNFADKDLRPEVHANLRELRLCWSTPIWQAGWVASGGVCTSLPLISASEVSPELQKGRVPTRAWRGLGQVSFGELQMPLQLFTSLVSSATPQDMIGVGFLRSESLSCVLSAAET